MERADPKTLAKHWHWEQDHEGLAWLTFDKQGESTNTFSREALNELSLMLDEIAAAKPKGLIIRSAKDSFIGGADIQEFANFKGPEDAIAFTKLGWDTFQKLHDLPFPTTAMVNGFCMGGGMEMSLACSYIVALDDPKTRFAQPEVMVGVIPAWHAMEWLPQRVGPAAAMDLLLTGKTIDAKRAKRIGLADQAVPLRIFENTARMITLEAPARKPLPFLQRILPKSIVASQARKQVARKAKREHYPVPYAIIDVWKNFGGNALAVPPNHPSSIPTLIRHPTGRNLVRIFFLQDRLKGLGKGIDFKARHVHIVGAGVMGGDIAAICAMRGLRVTLQDTAPERIAPAVKRAAELFNRRLRDKARERDALDRLIPDVSGEVARQADVLIEAIFENLEAKRSLFA
jgi:3-hydroxyacyl-CoA dehydrogenase / enoyl-CoA hydratase / 3-hydroxybutyryl-CoA epimerase